MASSWDKLAAALRDAGRSIVYDDPRATTTRLQAEGARSLLRTFANAAMMGLEHRADYPKLVRIFDTYRQHGNANPDCVYFYAEVSPEHTYRIHGRRGTARLFEVQIMDSHMLAHPNHKGIFDATDLEADADGHIDIQLGGARRAKNWVPLAPEARWLYVRQYYYDWETEIPADVAIERVGATYPPPPLDPAFLDERIEMLARLFPSFCRSAMNFVATYYAVPETELGFVQSKSGLGGLSYGKGHFTCGPDEAVILEFKPPRCVYWSFQLMNHFWESLDWDVRQTSLNGHQAELDADGVFRAVIARTDPGVPNWLDPAGHEGGLICGRVLRPEAPPVTTLTKVKLGELRTHLPASTRLVTPDERSATLRRRMLGVARRHRE